MTSNSGSKQNDFDKLIVEIKQIWYGTGELFGILKVHGGNSKPLESSIAQLASFLEFGEHESTSAPSKLSEAQAIERLCRMLSQDLAYNDKSMSPDEAFDFAKRFLNLFTSDRRFYNGQLGIPKRFKNTGCEYLCREGVIVVDDEKAGCLWIGTDD